MIVSNCSPSDPTALWMKFRTHLSEDILHRQRRALNDPNIDYSDATFNEALILIEDICLSMVGKLLIQLDMPAPNRSALDPFNAEVLRERSYDADELEMTVSTCLPQLNPGQKAVYETITSAISSGQGGLFFLDAPGGTGKTFIINLVLAHVRQNQGKAIACASSGIAATLLSGGRTSHSTFKLPLNLDRQAEPMCEIPKNSARARMLKQCQVIIWDECTMSHKKALEAVDRSLRDLLDCDSIFGGIVVLLSGDFRQTLPVIPKGTPADTLDACIKQSYLWRSVQALRLTTNMRVQLSNDAGVAQFAQQLLDLGEGRMQVDRESKITFPDGFCQVTQGVGDLTEKVFGELPTKYGDMDWLSERAILAPTNEMVNCLNSTIQSRILTEQTRYYRSIDTVCDEENITNYPVEVLNKLTPGGLPPHMLELKVRSPIMLLRNLDPPRLCNGTRLCVKAMHNNVIEATIIVGPHKGEDVFIPRIPLITEEVFCKFKRLQFPIRLAFAMTINKSQGQTLKIAGVELSKSVFSHGQLYVACSRVGSPRNLYVNAPDGRAKNVVFHRLYGDLHSILLNVWDSVSYLGYERISFSQ